MKIFTPVIAVSALIYSCASTASEHYSINNDGEWRFTVTPYIWASALDGSVSLKNLPEKDVNVGFDDVLKRLDSAFMGEVESRTEKFGFIIDYIYMDLSDSTSADSLLVDNNLSIDIKQSMVSASFFYNALRYKSFDIDAYTGIRYNNIKQSLNANIYNKRHNISLREDWIDPLIGIRFLYKINKDIYTKNSIDIGGFDMGSKITAQLSTSLAYRINEKLNYAIGYRIMKIDYSSDDLKYDMVYDGLFLNASYTF